MKPSTRQHLRTALLTLAGAALLAGIGATALVWSGRYDVSVTTQHLPLVYRLLEVATRQSVRHHARAEPPAPPDLAQRGPRGAACYRAHCLQCHGAAGMPPSPVGLAMQPLPGPLLDTA